MKLTIKNYKKLEGWGHDYKDFRIGEVVETENEYSFRVGYNGIPYTIKIFRKGTITNEYEMVLRDGADINQFGRSWVQNRKLKSFELTTMIFEDFIVRYKPKAQQINNPFYSNGPF
jgi:hypothetical protein